ncbi:MAG TPA: patatin [Gammaproteobacteria bacterium]|nr:patatin [Gammaproteobacteria bacterium]
MDADTPRIGLALGSGSSRGWAHIGIIRELAACGIRPHVICGCSIGAIVGASHAAGRLDRLEAWVRTLSRRELARFFELDFTLSGFVDADRFRDFLRQHVCDDDLLIESLPLPFATVSTQLETGREIWFTEGPVMHAVIASIALPGLFPPVRHLGHWLVDGGLVNPVPVSLCHALGAEVVIAVNLNGDIVGKHFRPPPAEGRSRNQKGMLESFMDTIKEYSPGLLGNGRAESPPSLFEAIAGAVNITQDRITRSRMAGDPPEILLNPRLSHIGLLEFHRAAEAIDEGRACVRRARHAIDQLLGGQATP